MRRIPVQIHRQVTFLVFALSALLLHPGLARAHAIAGMRVFPGTLSIDDPGVVNEFSTVFGSVKADGVTQNGIDLEYAKTLSPRFGLTVGGGYQWLNNDAGPDVSGWDNLSIGAQYQLFISARHEAIGMISLSDSVANTGSGGIGDSFSTYTPEFAFGKGFGDLPDSLQFLRPLAVTGAISEDFPTDPTVPHTVNWGLSLQYSIPYLQSFVKYVGLKAPFNRMVPIVELPMQTCLDRGCAGQTTGYVNPGVIWIGKYYQVGIEAQVPINDRTGTHVGVLVGVDLYLDDLLPRSLGRPLFR